MKAKRIGKLHLFHSTMNGSKSANLLMQMYNYEAQDKFVLAFKPSIDTRNDDMIKSRAMPYGHKAHPIESGSRGDILKVVRKHRNKNISRIFVDEIQFFDPEHIDELAQVAIQYGISVYCYGLINSYTGRIFPSIIRCLEVGFALSEIKMECDFCSNRATNHILFNNGKVMRGHGAEVFVGDTEYKSTCFACFDEFYNENVNV